MKNIRISIVIVCVAAIFVSFASVTRAAETQEIDALIQRAGTSAADLSSSDREIISEFVSDSIDELVSAQNGSEMIAVRTGISTRMLSDKNSKYRLAFSDILEENLLDAVNYVSSWEAGERKKQIQTNLIILAARLQSPQLVDFAVNMLSQDDIVIRYWAVKSLTGDRLVKMLNDPITADKNITDKILTALNGYIGPNTTAEVLAVISRFAADLEAPATNDMLLKIVDVRMRDYEDWTVDYEKADAEILAVLAGEAQNLSGSQKARFLGAFAQLYSYTIQRYILGQDLLDKENENYLIATMAEVEQKILPKLLGRPQDSIRKALDRGNLTELKQEHDRLFGSTGRKGLLEYDNTLDYGTDKAGQKLSGPRTLSPPPVPDLGAESENA
ncbi:hypothetical protein STSP2_02569 [Anaerohalosphaera lusitana]|uniref:HEAT repeat domain-containing protein n=1 Tax=Anaerohalosphaera lusitana TaxID=1936003 RepID=A0A1U9NP47_9BACT|nr:hypothetical protein [Anaerohalosphaera lusitana]AQT69380.1 hypothetical protein STSP2_02569 [Anaerohalosphaera lusitana]